MTQASEFRFHPKKIMVPVDFSESSDAAVRAAREIAAEFDAELFLLHVVPMLPNRAADSYMPEEQFVAEEKTRAEEKLTQTATMLNAAGRPTRSAIEIGNDIVGNILHVAQREQADLLVFSTHGMSGWRPAVFGSIAEQVMKLAECPVLLLRSSQACAVADHKASQGAEWVPAAA